MASRVGLLEALGVGGVSSAKSVGAALVLSCPGANAGASDMKPISSRLSSATLRMAHLNKESASRRFVHRHNACRIVLLIAVPERGRASIYGRVRFEALAL